MTFFTLFFYQFQNFLVSILWSIRCHRWVPPMHWPGPCMCITVNNYLSSTRDVRRIAVYIVAMTVNIVTITLNIITILVNIITIAVNIVNMTVNIVTLTVNIFIGHQTEPELHVCNILHYNFRYIIEILLRINSMFYLRPICLKSNLRHI